MDQTRPRAGLETRCPAFGVYASCPKLFLGRLVGPYAYVYGSCPCRQNQRQMVNTCSESSKLVVGRVGETVTLPCKYDINANGLLSICWGRHQSVFSCENTVISSDGLQVNYRESHRFSLASGLDRGDVSLTIRAAQNRDAGMYVCRIEIPGLFNDISYNVYLFISNGLDPNRVVAETQLVPTTVKQEKQVYYVSDPTTLITEFYVISETKTADVTDIYIDEPSAVVHTEDCGAQGTAPAAGEVKICQVPPAQTTTLEYGVIVRFEITMTGYDSTFCKCSEIIVQSFEGESVTLPCEYDSKYHGKCQICWMRGDIPKMGCGDDIIGTDGDKVVRRKSTKYQMVGEIRHGDVSLTIFNIGKTDSGKYGCRIHVPGLFNDEMYYVHLIVEDETNKSQENSSFVSSSNAPESSTIGLWTSNITYETTVEDPELSPVEHKDSVNASAVIVPVILLLLALIVIVGILIWKQKKKTSAASDIAQNSDISVIYSNSGSTVGLYNREMAVENVYQIQTENEYEQWH
ncbi:T-cell immunoglobulin and mucin domain-containing protein 4 [Anabarilius grahami]|nr:T-cell immunoglobulin and mucin domain-containing protein 4 [Anabarilius grahami]